MNQSTAKTLKKYQQQIARRLRKKNYPDQAQPMFQGGNLHYEIAARTGAISGGGLGAIHTLAQCLDMVQEIDGHRHLLKVHLPYHESDHMLNVAYNLLAGGVRLEDWELRRQDEHYLDSLGVPRIPDPTTAGDCTRECIERIESIIYR